MSKINPKKLQMPSCFDELEGVDYKPLAKLIRENAELYGGALGGGKSTTLIEKNRREAQMKAKRIVAEELIFEGEKVYIGGDGKARKCTHTEGIGVAVKTARKGDVVTIKPTAPAREKSPYEARDFELKTSKGVKLDIPPLSSEDMRKLREHTKRLNRQIQDQIMAIGYGFEGRLTSKPHKKKLRTVQQREACWTGPSVFSDELAGLETVNGMRELDDLKGKIAKVRVIDSHKVKVGDRVAAWFGRGYSPNGVRPCDVESKQVGTARTHAIAGEWVEIEFDAADDEPDELTEMQKRQLLIDGWPGDWREASGGQGSMCMTKGETVPVFAWVFQSDDGQWRGHLRIMSGEKQHHENADTLTGLAKKLRARAEKLLTQAIGELDS